MNRSADIEVEFIDKMGSDKRICNAARVSFAKWDETEEITEADKGLLKYLATGLPKAERDDWERRAKAHTHFTHFHTNNVKWGVTSIDDVEAFFYNMWGETRL